MSKQKKVAIVAAIHGDEVYGIELYNAFISAYPEMAPNILLVIGNQKAYNNHVRFIDTDMNRSYLLTDKSHEITEISRLTKTLDNFDPDYILDVHTTRRSSGIFFITDCLNEKKLEICNMFAIDVCIIKDSVIKTSLIGNNDSAVSLEYSLNAITPDTTKDFVDAVYDLISQTHPTISNHHRDIFDVNKTISKAEYQSYPGLQNYDSNPEGVALMVPKDSSEMDAEYYGFWCTKSS